MITPVIDPYYFLGFVEGEGTFGLKGLSPYFSVGQHQRSKALVEAIRSFIEALPCVLTGTGRSAQMKVSMTLNKKTNVLVVDTSDIDALFGCLLPFLLPLRFQSRKRIDFSL